MRRQLLQSNLVVPDSKILKSDKMHIIFLIDPKIDCLLELILHSVLSLHLPCQPQQAHIHAKMSRNHFVIHSEKVKIVLAEIEFILLFLYKLEQKIQVLLMQVGQVGFSKKNYRFTVCNYYRVVYQSRNVEKSKLKGIFIGRTYDARQ